MFQFNYTLLLMILLGVNAKLDAQHHIFARFKDDPHIEVYEISYMDVGLIDNNLMRFRDIDSGEDGEISFQLNSSTGPENLLIRFVNEATSDPYGIRITGGDLTVEEATNIDKGSYVVGDLFRIVRCSSTILFYHNDHLIHIIELADNAFSMVGEVISTSTALATAEIMFHPLP